MKIATDIEARDVQKYGKVAVLMGGTSAEREISLETGNAVYAALCRKGVQAYALDTKDAVICRMVEEEFDRAFIALHGRGGEDGVIQGALESLNIPYTGSGVLGSALSMDKSRCKWIWQSHGISTPAFIELGEQGDLKQINNDIGFPMIIKPVNEGSSCGAVKVKEQESLENAWRTATEYDDRVMAERWIDGAEYTAAVLNDTVLPLIRLETPREIYDYQAKYIDETTRYICPCGLAPDREQAIAELALKAFRLVGASGWGRVDLMVDDNGIAWMIEVNTIPGMTSHSLVPMAAKQAGIGFDELVIMILETSMQCSTQLPKAAP